MKYGASYNIYIDMGESQFLGEVGAPEEQVSIAFIGNDLTKIEQYLIADEDSYFVDNSIVPYVATEHEFIGKSVWELGGKVVSVICFDDDGEQVTFAVIFEDPDLPRIIE